jgi:hypothetical protein
MTKILVTVAILGSVAGLAGLALAQEKQGEASGSVSAQCAHRRTMPPDPRDNCARKLPSDAQLGYGQGASANGSQAFGGGPAPGIGPGNGGGQAKGRR